MKTMVKLAMMAGAATIAGLASASPARADPEFDRCMGKATSNIDFADCGKALVERRDGVLNAVWKKTYPTFDAQTKAALLADQRRWIAYKDKSCTAWQTGYFGREGQVLHFYTCRAGVIDARIEMLLGFGPGRRGPIPKL